MTRSIGKLTFIAISVFWLGSAHGVVNAQTVTGAPPDVLGSWTIREIRFGNGATALVVPTPAQKQELAKRVGTSGQITGLCGQGGPPAQQSRMALSEADLSRQTDPRMKRLASLGIESRGQGVVQITMMCGNAMAGLFYWVPGDSRNQIVGGRSANDMMDYELVLERVGNLVGQSGSANGPTASNLDDELRKRAENDGDIAAARELAKRYRAANRPEDYATKYEQLADDIQFAAASTALPNGRIAGRPARSSEPSFDEIRIAIRDMESCRSVARKSKLPWDGGLGWTWESFSQAVNFLTGHSHSRPDFTKDQRFTAASASLDIEINRQVDRAFPTQAGIPEAMAKCRARYVELRPMFTSYAIDSSRREQCIKVFASENFKVLTRQSAATKFELLAIFPDQLPMEDVVTRPDRVEMWFAYSTTRPIGYDGQAIAGEHWETSTLVNGCPARP